jgi:phenylalanyl-tRNA synthetase beta chain
MKFSHNWLQTYFEKPLPQPEKLAELLTMHIFEVEGVEEIQNTNGEILDYALDVKILPDRAGYAYAHANLAREINAFTDSGFKNKIWNDISVDVSLDAVMPVIVIDDPKTLPLFTVRMVSRITNNASPDWLRDSLVAVGQRPISLIVDLTNYVMLDVGQPMHAFDADKVKGNINIRYAKDGEKVTLLDGREVALDPTIMVIADEEAALDIAGIKGGKKAEVDSETKRIILLADIFDASYIRKTAQKVGIKNDSTKRYENAVTLERALLSQKEFMDLLAKEQNNVQASTLITYGKSQEEIHKPRNPIRVRADFISQKIGVNISTAEIVSFLKSLEIEAIESGNEIEIIPPLYRGDLNIAEDIIEEIARLKDMNSMPEVVPKADIAVPALPSFFYSNVARNALLGLGFSEIYTHTLIEEGDYALANPLTSERSHLRNNLAGGMKKALCFNVQNIDLLGSADAVADDVRIFDIGHVFKDKKEIWSLAIGVASKTGKQAKEKNKQTLQSAMQEVAKTLGLPMHEVECLETNENQTIIEGETEAIGGAVPVAYCIAEINFEKVLESLPTPEHFNSTDTNVPAFVDMKEVTRFERFSPYPYMVRDIAVFIPGATGRASQLKDLIIDVGDESGILKLVRPFDEFEKKNKETGEVEKTSYGFRMVFQSSDRTLTEGEVQGVMDQILKKIREKEGWEVR